MPVEMPDPDGGATSDFGRRRSDAMHFDGIRGRWWRPRSTVGRVFLGLCLLTVLSGLATGSFLLKTYLNHDPRFRIAGTNNIEVSGLSEVNRAEMLPIFGEDIGRNIFFVPLAERRKQLEQQVPWVERATVMRLLPDRIRISVVERHPVAFVLQGQQIGLVDANGVLLTMPPTMMAQRHYSFPVVTGIDAGDPLPLRKMRMAVYQRLMSELDANNQHLSAQISEIDLTDAEDARVRMQEQGSDILAHFGDDRFLERYQRYKAHIAEWRQQYPKLAAVDLRYNQQVVLQMAPDAVTAQSTPPEQVPPATPSTKPQIAAPPEKPRAHSLASAKTVSDKPASDKTTIRAKSSKTSTKPAVKNAGKASSQLKTATANDKKKRADTKRVALNVSRRKPTPITRSAVAINQGQ
jgi:cell division protein FtsQ